MNFVCICVFVVFKNFPVNIFSVMSGSNDFAFMLCSYQILNMFGCTELQRIPVYDGVGSVLVILVKIQLSQH